MESAVMSRSADGAVRAGGAAASASARTAVSMGGSFCTEAWGDVHRPGRLDNPRGRTGDFLVPGDTPSPRGRLRMAAGELSDVRRRSWPLQRSLASEAGGGGVRPRPYAAARRSGARVPPAISADPGAEDSLVRHQGEPPGRSARSGCACGLAATVEWTE